MEVVVVLLNLSRSYQESSFVESLQTRRVVLLNLSRPYQEGSFIESLKTLPGG